MYEIFHLFSCKALYFLANRVPLNSLLSVVTKRTHLINVRHEKVNFIFLRRLHLLNKCWQVSKGKIKLYINELRCIFFEEPFKTFCIIV